MLIAGRYRLEARLAAGGMGEVHRAVDTVLNRPVAVKLLRDEIAGHPDAVARFQREAQVAASLSHPNVAVVHDHGQHEGRWFIVMEFVDGETVEELLQRDGRVSPEPACRLAARVADALSAAHARGLVHRDIKPGNVMIGRDGRVRVTDFGVAAALAATTPLTRSGAVVGTPTYLSPEQARGVPVGPAADLYALGVLLFELLTGTPPYDGSAPMEVLGQHLFAPVPDLAAREPAVPAELAELTRDLLAKEPEQRPASAAAVAADLDRLAAAAPVPAFGLDTPLPAQSAVVPGFPPGGPGATPAASGPDFLPPSGPHEGRPGVPVPPSVASARQPRSPLVIAALAGALVVTLLLGVASTVLLLGAGWPFPVVAPADTGEGGAGDEASSREVTYGTFTLTLEDEWATEERPDGVFVRTDPACSGLDCPGFLILGLQGVALADRGGPYDPTLPYRPISPAPCRRDLAGGAATFPDAPQYSSYQPVGEKTAEHHRWSVRCTLPGDESREAYQQHLWYLPVSGLLVVDEWETEGLPRALAAAQVA